jgi:ABC-type sugar transport system permease subunit
VTEKSRSGGRHARLYLSRVDPWSVAKAAFMLAVAVGIIIVVSVSVLWLALSSLGVFETLSRNVNEVVGNSQANFDLMSVLEFSRVLGVTIVVASVEVILVSILATIFAFMYNLTVGLTGGVEVVLTDHQ